MRTGSRWRDALVVCVGVIVAALGMGCDGPDVDALATPERRLLATDAVPLSVPTGTSLSVHPEQGTVRWPAGATRFETVALGRPGAMRVVDPWAVAIERSDGETRRALWAGVTEWWRERALGLEHGVTVETRPSGQGALVVEIASSLTPRAIDGDAIALLDAAGTPVATYRHLVVYDATHTRMPARMYVDGARIALEVDDARAQYPLVIDPLFAILDELPIPLSTTNSVELAANADLTRLVVVAGAARGVVVFERTGGTWTDTGTLTSTVADGGMFGLAGDMSADGERIAVMLLRGELFDERLVEVFRHEGAGWVSEAHVVLNDESPTTWRPIALSADGMRLAAHVGARIDVYVRTGTSWSLEAGVTGGGGRRMTFDDTGSRLAMNGTVWRRTGSSWVTEASWAGATGDVAFAPGATRVAFGSGLRRGSVDVYVRAGTTWSLEGRLEPPRPIGGTDMADWDNDFGESLAFGPDARRLFVGAPFNDVRAGTSNDRDVGSLSVFQREGSVWTHEEIVFGRDEGEKQLARSLCVDVTGTRVVASTRDGMPDDGVEGLLRVFRVEDGRELGELCTADVGCLSGHCVDGVCCGSACGGNLPNDCQACIASLTGVPSGTCASLSASAAPTVTCRPSVAECDLAEVCVAGSISCPGDVLAESSFVCRPALTPCDAPERCTGTSTACPANAPSAAGSVCREAVSPCDITELCDGAGFACPSDLRSAADVTCRASAGPCDVEERCDGVSATCPNDAVVVAGTICLAAGPGACDAPDVCTGTSADCVPTFLSGVECRPSAGACDPSELCSGASELCPPDSVHPAATVCRAAVSSCDIVESCDGFAAQCPPDVTTCTGDEDAGGLVRDAGVGDAGAADAAVALTTDGAVTADATPDAPTPATGCACRTTARSDDGRWLGLALLGVLLALRGQRRRQARAPHD